MAVKQTDNPFWISFSDLMAGLLFVFILIFAVTILAYQEQEPSVSREKITQALVSMLLDQFQAKHHYPVEISRDTGTISVSEGVLFDFNQSELSAEGKVFLSDFIPKYCAILFDNPEIGREITAVIVEGHTDEVGSYQFNMGLSLRRAYSVVAYIFDPQAFPNFPYSAILQQKLSANGRSKVDLKNTSAQSRRVEFKFRLRDINAFETSIHNHSRER